MIVFLCCYVFAMMAHLHSGASFVPPSVATARIRTTTATTTAPMVWSMRQKQQQQGRLQPQPQFFQAQNQTPNRAIISTTTRRMSRNEGSQKETNGEDLDFQRRNQQWVVLVDDEESIRFAVGDFLYDRGYEVTACADANSLLDLIVTKNRSGGGSESETTGSGNNNDSYNNNNNNNGIDSGNANANVHHRLPDVIISDVRMPESDKNGYELVEFLRSADTSINIEASTKSFPLNQRSLVSLKNVPIVLLTAKAMTEDRIMGYRAGADVVLPKPFAPEELVSILDNLIRRQHERLQPRRIVASPPRSPTAMSSSNDDFRALKRELDEIKAIVRQNAATTVQKTDVVLTDKERRIVGRLAEGYTAREIAMEVIVRPQKGKPKNPDKDEIAAVRKIVEGLCDTTGTDSKTELIRWARAVGYIPP